MISEICEDAMEEEKPKTYFTSHQIVFFGLSCFFLGMIVQKKILPVYQNSIDITVLSNLQKEIDVLRVDSTLNANSKCKFLDSAKTTLQP